ncbi:MAG: LPS export ABC transporter permease LptF [Desulfotignum sp.]|nr:LPS export ABC transporter permease LptF [Desulfotignum sp.]MCF8112814.1 LPS export ABC transporter permease LptF [Desulfotignum sp.]MCF8124696.1 LPS export ABC transporter permease LptF [Desulfotignum sp.]
MIPANIINRYIFREFFPPFGISLFFLTFVFLMTRIPEITNMVVNYNADMAAVFMMIIYTLPRFLEFTIPMSVMVAVLLTFLRMSGENEIVALKGAGLSLYRLLPPVLVFCFLGTLLALLITLFGVSWGKLSIKQKTLEMARSSIDLALQERQFNSQLKDIMIYVSHVDMKTKDLTDVFIEDRTVKGTTRISMAPEGRLIRSQNDNVYTIRLYNGMINQVDVEKKTVSTINFGHYDINIDLAEMQQKGGEGGVHKDLDEYSLVDLVRFIRTGTSDKVKMSEAKMVLHEKFSVPFACLFMGLLAFPLGVQSLSAGRSSGLGMGVFFLLVYYFFLAAGWSAGETGYFPPVLGMWLPNLVMGGAGMYLLKRNARENPVKMPLKILKAGAWIQRQFMKLIRHDLPA